MSALESSSASRAPPFVVVPSHSPPHYLIALGVDPQHRDTSASVASAKRREQATNAAKVELSEHLYTAASLGDLAALRKAFKAGASASAQTPQGATALHMAAAAGHEKCCRALLEEMDADINHRDAEGYTALHLAMLMMKEKCLFLLHENGADSTLKSHSGLTARDVGLVWVFGVGCGVGRGGATWARWRRLLIGAMR